MKQQISPKEYNQQETLKVVIRILTASFSTFLVDALLRLLVLSCRVAVALRW